MKRQRKNGESEKQRVINILKDKTCQNCYYFSRECVLGVLDSCSKWRSTQVFPPLSDQLE
jgi:hypothetical protein